jgi:predicted acylesterase/phospholipase RssA
MEGLASDIRHISGTSIGAFFATALALNIPYPELEELMREFCTKKHTFSTAQILNIFTSFGIDNGDFMVEALRKYIQKITDGADDISFIDLSKRTGKNLVICANRIETMKAFYFCVDTTPSVGILEACTASMAVPMFICPKKIGEFHYSDGATNDNTPTACFKDCDVTKPLKFVLSAAPSPNAPQPMTSMISYILAHFDTYFTNLIKRSSDINDMTVHLDMCPVAFLPFTYTKDGIILTVTDDEFERSLSYGYSTLQEWFTRHCSDDPSEQ